MPHHSPNGRAKVQQTHIVARADRGFLASLPVTRAWVSVYTSTTLLSARWTFLGTPVGYTQVPKQAL